MPIRGQTIECVTRRGLNVIPQCDFLSMRGCERYRQVSKFKDLRDAKRKLKKKNKVGTTQSIDGTTLKHTEIELLIRADRQLSGFLKSSLAMFLYCKRDYSSPPTDAQKYHGLEQHNWRARAALARWWCLLNHPARPS